MGSLVRRCLLSLYWAHGLRSAAPVPYCLVAAPSSSLSPEALGGGLQSLFISFVPRRLLSLITWRTTCGMSSNSPLPVLPRPRDDAPPPLPSTRRDTM
ncbi:hypothetical protein B0H13DRAFT_2026985 [Mycena leptocephala]|nr:hypothetical protein B0H13DRAFT_2026985 [Mycena leptocephala]